VPEGEGFTSAETSVDIYLSIQHDIPEEEGATILGMPGIIFAQHQHRNTPEILEFSEAPP